MLVDEKIYIAGPECFYENGFKIWNVLKEKAEILGAQVTLPNDMDFDFTPKDRRIIADEIFENCVKAMNNSTAIIADLEAFRSSEPDCGTVYEIGMAFAKGAKCYGYTRDKRTVAWKNQKGELVDLEFVDEAGRKHPYHNLPFCPSLVGSTKIIEGDYDDCLKMFTTDIEEEIKTGKKSNALQMSSEPVSGSEKPVIYLSGPERYDRDAVEKYSGMKELCIQSGFIPLTPLDVLKNESSNQDVHPYEWAAGELHRWMSLVQKCDIILANLNDFRGWEPCNDTAFECGAAFQIGKKLYGYMDDTSRMIDRIPNYGKETDYKDECGNVVENFDYPINLMFSSSMEILEGDFKSALQIITDNLKPDV